MDKSVKWPSEKYTIADHAHVHAIGQISLIFNLLEDAFCGLFELIFPAGDHYSEHIAAELSNRERVDMLKALVEHSENDPALSALLLDAVRFYDICTDNRNIIMHSMARDSSSEVIRLYKKANRSKKTNHYELPISELRAVADEMAAIYIFFVRLYSWILRRNDGETMDGALPSKPAQPRSLIPSRPGEAPATE